MRKESRHAKNQHSHMHNNRVQIPRAASKKKVYFANVEQYMIAYKYVYNVCRETIAPCVVKVRIS